MIKRLARFTALALALVLPGCAGRCTYVLGLENGRSQLSLSLRRDE